MKIVEASGVPLVQLLKPSFVMEKGCALGLDCHLCDNTGVGCATKNVVYSAECVLCSSEHTEDQYEDTISSTRALFHEATENTEEQYQEVISIPSPQLCEGTLETEEQYQDVISSLSPQYMEANQQIYIGETSRPIRNRVLEHLKKLKSSPQIPLLCNIGVKSTEQIQNAQDSNSKKYPHIVRYYPGRSVRQFSLKRQVHSILNQNSA